MILGAEKEAQVQDNPLMKYYFNTFQEKLSSPGSRLLILGYSLTDFHINKIIFEAIEENDLKFWRHYT